MFNNQKDMFKKYFLYVLFLLYWFVISVMFIAVSCINISSININCWFDWLFLVSALLLTAISIYSFTAILITMIDEIKKDKRKK